MSALSWTSACWNPEAAHSFRSHLMSSYSARPIPGLQEKHMPENLGSGEGADASPLTPRLGDHRVL